MVAQRNPQAPLELPLTNQQIARRLEEAAELLETQEANLYRVRAYRIGAEMVRRLDQPVKEILDKQGLTGLNRLPGIGMALAPSIDRLCRTGRLGLLERKGTARPEDIFTTLPGIGPQMANRIHELLGIESLADLEAAANDGRLAGVPGMARKRLRAVRESLSVRLRHPLSPVQPLPPKPTTEAPVSDLLDIDREYRRKAEANKLARIAPKRFNPTAQAWLPVLHTKRGDRHYTALYSNTARAHALGMTHDWVVIYRDDRDCRGQWTVITARYGPLQGRRIIRGRERECTGYFAREEEAQAKELFPVLKT